MLSSEDWVDTSSPRKLRPWSPRVLREEPAVAVARPHAKAVRGQNATRQTPASPFGAAATPMRDDALSENRLPLDDCRRALGNRAVSDDELLALRDQLYPLAEIMVSWYLDDESEPGEQADEEGSDLRTGVH